MTHTCGQCVDNGCATEWEADRVFCQVGGGFMRREQNCAYTLERLIFKLQQAQNQARVIAQIIGLRQSEEKE